MALRTIAALGGSYIVTALAAACAARLLPTTRVEATVAATLGAFAVYPILALAAFSARSTGRVWLFMTAAALILTAILALTPIGAATP